MAFINVAEWTPGQVTDWLKGLDDSMGNYVNSFTNNEVGGRQLLNIRPYELEQLGMHSIGHQEIVLEAVENLRNIHYNLDKENLQFMALHVATAAHSLYRQLATHCYASQIETQILSDITRTIGTIKPLIGWLERAPFQGQLQFTEICRNMLRLGLEMATIAQRDRFVERPVEQIRGTAEKLDRLANYIIQDITDPMLLQPASLNLVTVKKRDLDPGFEIEPNYHGVHRISQIKYNSPAHARVEIEAGDEIVQIHYQTVVGWQGKTVWHQLHVSPPDVVLTLKKRPKHTNIYGQTYTQPFPLPSKKRVTGTRWGENLPSPRASFLTVPNTAAAFDLSLTLKTTIAEKITTTTSDSDSSENLTPTETKVSEKKLRLYNEKPRSLLQRRHTICGDMMGGGGEDLQRHKPQTSIVGDPASPSLRDKSKSFGYGLELASRPKTCIELSGAVPKVDEDSAQVQEQGQFAKAGKSEGSEEVAERQNTSEADRSKPGVCKVVRFDASMKYTDYQVDEKYTCNVDNTILETFEPIPFADEEDEDTIDAQRNAKLESTTPTTDRSGTVEEVTKSESVDLVEAINVPILARRARLDKSHSTPAYDNTGDECDTPPAIEPRKEFILQTPPVPPPRPRKQKDIMPPPVPPPPPLKPPALQANTLSSVALGESDKSTNHVDSVDTNRPVALTLSPVNGCSATAVSELHTPTKSRTLTLKKKHSLIAKRRNVNLKILGTGDIQGHLYRRTKDRRGVTFWARLYFVMLDTILYGFRSKEALKASCVIFLPGFTVSLAKEVHSKPHAFKVYHAAKTFYFAVESQDALNQWVELLRQATIQPHALTSMAYNSDGAMDDIKTKELFSETDSSGEESESVVAKNLCTPSPRAMTQDGIASGSIGACSATPVTSVKNERRYLGSLRKLTKGTLPFKSASASGEKKLSSDIPVPTDQYRSYRKVPGGSFGIQIGTNTPGYHMDPTLQLPLNTSNVKPPDYAAPQRKLSLSSSRSSIVSNGADSPATSLSLCLGPPSSPAPTIQPATLAQRHQQPPSLPPNSPDSTSSTSSNTLGKSIKKIPYNFLHASNPNLVEFDFQTSKTLDYSLPKINPANSWEAHHSAQSFITLKDLMLQKQKEEAQEMYNNRVLLGVERKDERGAYVPGHTPQPHGSVSGDVASSSCGNSNKLSKTQSRSLPKTPDYEISFKPDDEDIRRTRTKEGLKLRDFGYELIYGDEPVSTGSGATAQRQLSNVSSASSSAEHHTDYSGGKSRPFVLLSHKHKKHSSNSCSSTSSVAELVNEKRAGSFKKKSKSERIFQQFSKHASGGGSSASSGMTMTLPLNKKTGGGSAIKKSHTYNNDLKDKASVKYEAHRKNSAPMPIFTMLSTTFGGTGGGAGGSNNSIARSAKEKKILGSPLLHRTIFGGSHHQSQDQLQQSTIGLSTPVTPTCTGREYDREIFSQVIFPKVSSHGHSGHSGHSGKFRSHHGSTSSAASSIITAPDTVAPPPPLPPHERDANANAGSAAATPEYPHMECPPVFEAEIYSLSESNANQTLLVRRKNSGSNGVEEK